MVNRAFSGRRVAGLEPAIRAIAAELVDALPTNQPVDVVPTLAVPLPMTGDRAINWACPRADLDQVKRWSDAVARELSGLVTSVDEQVELSRMALAFQRYFHALIQDRRRSPRDDVMSDLVRPPDGDTDGFDDADVLAFLQQLLVAGNETTTSAIAALVRRLADEPALQEAVRADQSAPCPRWWRRSCASSRRFKPCGASRPRTSSSTASPFPRAPFCCCATCPPTAIRCTSTSRTPAGWTATGPATTLAFGAGIHFCAGASLARMEIRVAAELLLARTAHIEPAWDDAAGASPEPAAGTVSTAWRSDCAPAQA